MEKTHDEKTAIVLKLFDDGLLIPGEVSGLSMFDAGTDILVFFYMKYGKPVYLTHNMGASECIDNRDAVFKNSSSIYDALVANNLIEI